MGSYIWGKKFVVDYLKNKFPVRSNCLDIGPCNGKWFRLLGNYFVMDAVEAWKPYIIKHKLENKYRNLTHASIVDFVADNDDFHYDIIIMGDVLEHLTVEDGQKVINKIYPRCQELVVAVPFLFKQRAIRGNPFEIHIQEDLTPELFEQRYPGFKAIWQNKKYCYYVKDEDKPLSNKKTSKK